MLRERRRGDVPERGHEDGVEVEEERGEEGVRSLLRRGIRALFQLGGGGAGVVVALLGWSWMLCSGSWMIRSKVQWITIQKVIDRLQRNGRLSTG